MIIDLKELNGNPRNIYGQAKVFKKGVTFYLISYETVIATYTKKGGLKRTWGGYSRTSLAHLNYFNNYMNLKKLSGAAWKSMEVHTPKYKTFKEVLQA